MTELKLQCDCGQKYKFDVEPVNGQMPFKVNCPICGADGTSRANEMLRLTNPAPAMSAPASVMSAPTPVMSAPAPVGAPAVPAGAPKLRIGSVSAHAATVAPEAPAAPIAPIPGQPSALPRRFGGAPVTKDGKPKRKPNFPLGLPGVVLGSLVGAAVYYLVFKYTGFRIGIIAIGVGFLAGLGGRLLGGEQEGNELGLIAGAVVVGAIIGAQYLVAHAWWTEGMNAAPSSNYEARVAEAKKVVAAIPNGSDDEIKMYLAKLGTEDGEKPDLASISADDVKTFRESALPQFNDLASGKISKADYEKQHAQEIAKEQDERNSEEGTFKAVFLLLMLNRVNLVSLCAAVGLAYKMNA
jgi:hypothetical protein